MQYPTLPLALLQDALRPYPDILLVDNEAPFVNAVRQDGPAAVFTDLGYGGFGHATARGNRMLAEQVATVILDADERSRPDR